MVVATENVSDAQRKNRAATRELAATAAASTSTWPSRASSMRSVTRRPSSARTVRSSRWPRASREGTVERMVIRVPAGRGNVSTTLAPVSRSCAAISMTSSSITPSNRSSIAPRAKLSSPPRWPAAAMRASVAASDNVATTRTGSTRSSRELKPGSCARAVAGQATTRAAMQRTAALTRGGERIRVTSVVNVPASVLRGGLVRKDLVEGHIVRVDVVARGAADDGRARAQIADQRRHGDVHDVVTEAAAVRPPSRDGAPAEAGLYLTDQHVAAEDAEP